MEFASKGKEETDKYKYTMMYMCEKEKDPESCHKLGYYYEVIESKFKKAKEYYEDNCLRRSHAESCHKMGSYMFRDRGGYKSKRKDGLEALSENCFERGMGISCMAAGGIYLATNIQDGKNPFRDTNKAIQHLEKGCEIGASQACDYAGMIFFEGKYVPRNATKALNYFTKGCDMASLTSCKGAAEIVKDGLNEVKRDEKKYNEFVEKFEFVVKTGMSK